jgi:Flp pilus assembly protein TadD
MKSKVLITTILLASLVQAKAPKVHQSGTLLQMGSAECGVDECRQGRLDEALTEARTAVEMAPQRMQAHLTLAQVLTRAKQFPQARAVYGEAIRLAELGEAEY